MAKFAALFVAALAFTAVLAGASDDWQRQQRRIQKLQRSIQEISQEAANALDSAHTESTQDRRALMTQTNEFAHSLQNIVYNMQRAAQNAQGEDKKTLQQIAMKMSEIAYTAQQAMNSEPTQMKTQLKTQVQNCAAEAEKLAQHFQQMQQPQQGQWENVNEMKRAFFDLHSTMRRVQVQAQHQKKDMQEVNNQMQTVANQMSMYTQNLNVNDEQAAQDLADYAEQLSQLMNNMVNKLQRESDNQQGEARNLMQQVANKLSEMRTNLDQVANTQGNTQQRVSEMKERLNMVMRDCCAQIQRLMQVAQQSNAQEGQGVKAVIKNVMMDCMAAGKTMQVQYQAMMH